MERIWSECDKAIARLIKYNTKLFSDTKTRLYGFDELNMKNTKPIIHELYNKLERKTEDELLSLILLVYDLYLPQGSKHTPPDKKWLKRQLEGFDGTLLFIYLNEVERKRDRLLENLLSIYNSQTNIDLTIKKASSLWARQMAQIVDQLAFKALIKAYKDSGVTMVRWVTQKDNKVCATCDRREGVVYAIDNIPDKHWNCRCFLTPIK